MLSIYYFLRQNGAGCIYDIKPAISIENAAFERKTLFTRKFDVNMKNKRPNTAFNGDTTYIFWKIDQNYLESFGIWR